MTTIAPKPLTGTKVLVILVAFFAVVIGVNMTMMKLAIATLPGTDVDSPYAVGLTYEKEIIAAHDQAARNWQVNASVQRSSEGAAAIEVEARDALGNPVTGLKFSVRLERPIDKRSDKSLELAETGTGVYQGAVSSIAAGQWDLVLEGEDRGERKFMSRNRVILN